MTFVTESRGVQFPPVDGRLRSDELLSHRADGTGGYTLLWCSTAVR